VFGASGNTGGAAAAHLLKSGKKVRVVGRQREKLAALAKAGAESCVGDIENAGFVREALSGAEGAYVLIPPNMATDDFRAYQARVIDTLVGGIEAAGVRHVALLSSLGAHHAAGTGPIVGSQLRRAPQEDRRAQCCFVRASSSWKTSFMGMGSIKAQGIYTGAMPAEAAMPLIAAADIGLRRHQARTPRFPARAPCT
jgi:NAD(P)-dependent dehydrogenase (short-subunit alcohol dehydrogenase family)